MALQNLFDMVKADRYTQDGCEKIIRAKSEIEDVKYNIGDISQKTGLMKTANGWVEPKNGKAAGAKNGEGKKALKLPDIPDFKGKSSGDFDIELRRNGWQGDWEGNENRAVGVFKKNGKRIRVIESPAGKIASVTELKDSAPRVLTGDCKVRIRKA